MKRSVAVLVTLFVVIVGYYWYANSQKTNPESTLKIGIDAGAFVSAPMFIADEKGYWKEEGLNVELHGFSSGKEAVGALLSNSVDMATMADMAFMIAAHRDSTLVLYSPIASSPYTHEIVGNRNAGINSLASLKGKKVGVTVGTGGQFFLDVALQSAGLSISDIKILNQAPPNLSSALANGSLDAICSWQPYIYNSMNAIDKPVLLKTDDYNTAFIIATHRNMLDKKQDKMKAFFTGLVKAMKFISTNKDEAILIVSKRTKADPAYLKKIWDEYNFSLDERPYIINNLKRQEKWAKANNIFDKDEKDINWVMYLQKD